MIQKAPRVRKYNVPNCRMSYKDVRHYNVDWNQYQKDGDAGMVYALALDEFLASLEQRITWP